MLSNMSDEKIATLLKVAKKNKALRPFFGSARGMILLREEAARRGIYATKGEASKVFDAVTSRMEGDLGKSPQPH